MWWPNRPRLRPSRTDPPARKSAHLADLLSCGETIYADQGYNSHHTSNCALRAAAPVRLQGHALPACGRHLPGRRNDMCARLLTAWLGLAGFLCLGVVEAADK